MASRDRFVPESDPVMTHNTSNTNSLSTVTEMNRVSATFSSSASATIDDASVTYSMVPVRGSNPDEELEYFAQSNSKETCVFSHTRSCQSDETGQVEKRLHGIRKDTISEPCRRKENVSFYDEFQEFAEPTVCTEDCELKKYLRTICDYEAAIRHHLERLRTHSKAKNAAIWSRLVVVDGKRQKKKSYQKKEPKVIERSNAAENDRKRESYWEGKESMDEKDELLEKLYDELSELLDELQKWISKETYLYHLLSTRDQFWPSQKFLSDDPIIDELKKVIADKVGTLNLADKKQVASRKASVLSRCKNKMFQNCFKVFYDHAKELENHINMLLDLKLGEVEPPQAKRKRLSGEEEEEEDIQSVVTRNINNFSRPVQSTPIPVEDILEELEIRLSSRNTLPLTYGQLEHALGQDIRPILREFLMDPTQTVDNTVRELVQLSNNQYIQPRTPDTTILLVNLRDPIVWRMIIFDWLAAERKTYFSTAKLVTRIDEPQDSQITSYDNGSICKTTDTTTAHASCSVPETANEDDSLEDNHVYSPTGVQKEKSVDLSSNNSAIPPANEWGKSSGNNNLNTNCSNGTTSPLTKEYDTPMNGHPALQPPSSTGDATVSPSDVDEVLDLDTRTPWPALPWQHAQAWREFGDFDKCITDDLAYTHPGVYNREQ